ncbi:MAG: hypothetical protein B6U78_00330 [Candidatus Aenigmarchaeota archaeon ex4484_224]|nr:MAG: hypothetical protein B6U78_00330 [Candidatus Aenigmarchaeota archaeon ex4484_224]
MEVPGLILKVVVMIIILALVFSVSSKVKNLINEVFGSIFGSPSYSKAEKAILCAYYRCEEGCDSPITDQYCDEWYENVCKIPIKLGFAEGSEKKICNDNSAQWPVEIPLEESYSIDKNKLSSEIENLECIKDEFSSNSIYVNKKLIQSVEGKSDCYDKVTLIKDSSKRAYVDYLEVFESPQYISLLPHSTLSNVQLSSQKKARIYFSDENDVNGKTVFYAKENNYCIFSFFYLNETQNKIIGGYFILKENENFLIPLWKRSGYISHLEVKDEKCGDYSSVLSFSWKDEYTSKIGMDMVTEKEDYRKCWSVENGKIELVDSESVLGKKSIKVSFAGGNILTSEEKFSLDLACVSQNLNLKYIFLFVKIPTSVEEGANIIVDIYDKNKNICGYSQSFLLSKVPNEWIMIEVGNQQKCASISSINFTISTPHAISLPDIIYVDGITFLEKS